ncbi:MAG: MlaA family lipoprotein [Pseudomonadota bacterium]
MTRVMRGFFSAPRLLIFASALSGLAACATKPPASEVYAHAEYASRNDPLEPLNRATYNFSNALDALTLRPLAKGYRAVVPDVARVRITHALDNAEEPWNFVNLLLQGKFTFAGETLGRFVINSTVGVAGLWDHASTLGLPMHEEDLGQTFASWGIPEGPYLYLPLLGPSNPRDFVGLVGQLFGDPVTVTLERHRLNNARYSLTGMQILDARTTALDSFDRLRVESADPYAAIRSAYRQNRAFAISDGALTSEDDPFAEDAFDAPDAEQPSPPQPPPE